MGIGSKSVFFMISSSLYSVLGIFVHAFFSWFCGLCVQACIKISKKQVQHKHIIIIINIYKKRCDYHQSPPMLLRSAVFFWKGQAKAFNFLHLFTRVTIIATDIIVIMWYVIYLGVLQCIRQVSPTYFFTYLAFG